MKPITLSVDQNAIIDAAIAQAASTIGSTVMNQENCDVTFKKGRKTATNPEPELEVTVEFYPSGKPSAVAETAPAETVEAEKAETEAPVEEVVKDETVKEEATEAPTTGSLFQSN